MKILFVCTGNTCRSPMAAALYTALGGKGEAHSAGISVYGARGASENTRRVMRDRGIDISSHVPTQITGEIVSDSDLILTMTNTHKNVLIERFPEAAGKIHTISGFCGADLHEDVADPFGGDYETYKKCAEQLERMLLGVIKKINEEYDANNS